jgi:hypothetical protein
MEELIFIALILFFSILESVARRRKRRTGPPQADLPGEWDAEEPEVERQWPKGKRPGRVGAPTVDRAPRETQGAERGGGWTPVSTYDADGSYEDVLGEEAASSRELPSSEPGRPAAQPAPPASSEGMIPADIWKEIEALAGGRRQEVPVPGSRPKPSPRPRPAPRPPAPVARPRKPARLPVPSPRPAPERETPLLGRAEGKRIHLAHAEFGTDPSERKLSPHDRLGLGGPRLGLDQAAARRQLRSGDRRALRQAVMVQEILGPPVSMRPEPFSQ